VALSEPDGIGQTCSAHVAELVVRYPGGAPAALATAAVLRDGEDLGTCLRQVRDDIVGVGTGTASEPAGTHQCHRQDAMDAAAGAGQTQVCKWLVRGGNAPGGVCTRRRLGTS
jgi:hypothetical protein